VLSKVFAQEKLDKANLGELINLISTAVLGTKEAQSKDTLGKVYEYFYESLLWRKVRKAGSPIRLPVNLSKIIIL